MVVVFYLGKFEVRMWVGVVWEVEGSVRFWVGGVVCLGIGFDIFFGNRVVVMEGNWE